MTVANQWIWIGRYADLETRGSTTPTKITGADTYTDTDVSGVYNTVTDFSGQIISGSDMELVTVYDMNLTTAGANDCAIGTDDRPDAFGSTGSFYDPGGYTAMGESLEYTVDGRTYGDGGNIATKPTTGGLQGGNGGGNVAIDSITPYTATITGTNTVTGAPFTGNYTLYLIQTDAGDVFLQQINAPDNIAIASITFLTKQAGTNFTFTNTTSRSWNNTTFVCFAGGTMIETQHGPLAVEELAVGDMVSTVDNGDKAISWIGKRKVTAEMLAANPNMLPVRIKAGALGDNMPETDLVVSRQHRVMVRSKIARRMFDVNELLVPAKDLLDLDGVDLATDIEEVTYYHFLFDQHEVVTANGLPAESLYTGKWALEGLGEEACAEIFAIFPELAEMDHDQLPPSARTLVNGRKVRSLVARHVKAGKPLYDSAAA